VRTTPVLAVGLIACLHFAPFAVAAEYQSGAVADGGTIKGKVIYKGTVPTKTVLPTKDKETCGGPRKDPLVIVGPGGEVKEAVVHLKEVGKGKEWVKAAKKPEIDNVKCVFVPHVQVIPTGMVDIVNNDPVLHNTHGYYGTNTAFNVALPIQGGRVSKPLRRPGVVRVDCDAHGWMEGWIYVVDNPYYALTAADGTFTISDVPPGNYTLVVWQEHTGLTEMPVTVKAKDTVQVPIELKK
jgi:hypothetical protein